MATCTPCIQHRHNECNAESPDNWRKTPCDCKNEFHEPGTLPDATGYSGEVGALWAPVREPRPADVALDEDIDDIDLDFFDVDEEDPEF